MKLQKRVIRGYVIAALAVLALVLAYSLDTPKEQSGIYVLYFGGELVYSGPLPTEKKLVHLGSQHKRDTTWVFQVWDYGDYYGRRNGHPKALHYGITRATLIPKLKASRLIQP